MKRFILGFALVAGAFLSASTSNAQYTMIRSVVGSGGQPMTSSAYTMVGTVGQPAIGFVSGTYTGSIGFWFVPAGGAGVEDVAVRTGGNVLRQNEPNPFNESTTIRFNLVKRSDVTLKVFNTAGQEVATLASGMYDGGDHDVQLRGAKLTSGVYIYQMKVDGFVMQRQMMVVR